MAQMTGGQALMRSLYLEGVRVIFGLPGVQLYHALDALRIARPNLRGRDRIDLGEFRVQDGPPYLPRAFLKVRAGSAIRRRQLREAVAKRLEVQHVASHQDR